MAIDNDSREQKQPRYLIPAEERENEIIISKSRFIARVASADSVEQARIFINRIREQYPDASHHVPAFIIGVGRSVIEHSSDDGEPSGTAGRPILAVLKGSGLGDIVMVVTRYFGGIKLGTGGLVRAYTRAAKEVLDQLEIAAKIATVTVSIVVPYSYFAMVKMATRDIGGIILTEDFSADVTLTAQLPAEDLPIYQARLRELSNGSIQAGIIETNPGSVFPAGKLDFSAHRG